MVQYKKGRASPWQVQTRDAQGKIVTASFERKADAVEFEGKERTKKKLQRHGLQAPMDDILFIDRVKTYLTKVYQRNAKSSADQDEGRFRNYWLEKFGNRPLVHITTAEIKEHLDFIQFSLGHTPADRNRHRALLHSFFHDAFMDDKVVANPVAKIPLVEENKRRIKFGEVKSEEEMNLYLDAIHQVGPEFGMMAMIMVWTGCRIMTAAAMQYHDVDFKLGIVRLRRLIEKASGEVVERQKGEGEGGENVLPLFPDLRHAINARRESSQFIRPTDFIACNEQGEFITYDVYRTAHEKALEICKLPRFTPHAVRRFFATNAKRAGYTRAEIREMLGHSSEAVTARYDLKDVEHLVSKGERLKFGSSVSQLSAKKGLSAGFRGRK